MSWRHLFLLSSLVACGGGNTSLDASADAESDVLSNDAAVMADVAMEVVATDATARCPSGGRVLTPPTGRLAGASDGAPGARRLLLATSANGGAFTRSERVLTDQGNTPNAVLDPGDVVRFYYTGGSVDGTRDGLAVAVSCDRGQTWRYYALEINGLMSGPIPGDPDVVRTSEGYTLYFTRGLSSNRIGIHRATSTDGFSFTYAGVAFEHSSENVLDSLTAQVGTRWHMYTLTGMSLQMTHGTSMDGAQFMVQGTMTHLLGMSQMVLSNWLQVPGMPARIYAFNAQMNEIRSFTTTDGTTLSPDPTTHLMFRPGISPLENRMAIDPAVVRFSDGSHLMAYVSMIP